MLKIYIHKTETIQSAQRVYDENTFKDAWLDSGAAKGL